MKPPALTDGATIVSVNARPRAETVTHCCSGQDHSMKFGTFYEHQLPRPWRPGAELRLFQDALDQVELADRLGFDHMWEVEHHFLEEYAHSSAPEIFLAAASQRTKRIRLGHGIVLLPPAYNHPARVAERIATLDLVSNGRVEFGTGESSAEVELGGFNIPRAEKRAMWLESLGAICRMFVEDPFKGHQGKYFQMPERNVVPKPVQRPHPPLWVACSQRETIRLAARHGIGALSFAFVSPDEARMWVDDYYRTLANECVPVGYTVNPNIAFVTGFMCDRDAPRARAMGEDGLKFFAHALGHYYVFGQHQPGATDIWSSYKKNPVDLGMLGAESSCIGTPDEICTRLRAFEDAGVDQVIFVSQAGNNRHEDICSSLDLFGREVLPEFQEREARGAAAKAERMAPIIAAAMNCKPGPETPSHDTPTIVRAGMLP
jgi:alkanesulfonate monooxygenase SsuD/methylene tetrahydromethanopterin reductase-like flavin-dependent oxidoreductase (luciferase family)